jgi:hypothetical protein
MKWTKVVFKGDQTADVQLGEVCHVTLSNVQKADVGYGNMKARSKVGDPVPAPRYPGDDGRQHE